MPKTLESNGKCAFCNNLFSASEIEKHLGSCEIRKTSWETVPTEPLSKKEAKKIGTIFGLRVWASYDHSYWLFLEADAEAFLEDLDDFLRAIWLECCGHLSAFTIGENRFEGGGDMFSGGSEGQSMHIRLGKVLSPGLTAHYEYDFGSTTDLDLEVIWEREGKRNKEKISILARNESQGFKCVTCSKPAAVICSECSCEYEKEALYCDRCIKKHKCGEDMSLPVVNSPRMGVCGYAG
ncbi:MAG: hypothetical protein HY587_07485 [Candidatus Omnitrophica bacterium]|nr:hypothetical protein [Candidatus Omnitrophota bacterium]